MLGAELCTNPVGALHEAPAKPDKTLRDAEVVVPYNL